MATMVMDSSNNHHPHQSSALQIYSCALTGLSPLADPVVTPSGYICSRKLLVTKLAENGGIDPFDDKGVRRLEEGALIDLAITNTNNQNNGTVAAIIPPRAPKSTSLPHLLAMMQSEFDAVLLELYDTRRALEETRRELSSALYQNDAAIRVVARLAAERDESRATLERYLSGGDSAGTTAVASSSQKRAREEDDDFGVPAVPTKSAKVNNTDDSVETAEGGKGGGDIIVSANDITKIPSSDLDAMTATWNTLFSSRRAITKLKRKPEEISKNESLLVSLQEDGESKRANLGKATAKAGVLCMTSLRTPSTTTEYLITGGHDKNATVYNVSLGRIVASLTGASGDIITVHGNVVAAEEGSSIQVVTGSTDGHVRLYELMLTENKEMEATLRCAAKLENNGVPVDVVLHPSSTKEDVRVLVASSSGRLELYKWSSGGDDDLKLLTRMESSKVEDGGKVEYTSGCMHPDGFIYVAGTSHGSLIVWDLKTQSVAGTLTGHDGLSIDCIAISENGYHVATSSSSSASDINSPIHVWDLRKVKLIATITPADDVGTVMSLAFDPTASYLAYSGETCTKICVAKDWDRVVCTLTPSKKGVATKKGVKDSMGGKMSGTVVWGSQGFGLKEGDGGSVWLAFGRDGERPVRFWGVK